MKGLENGYQYWLGKGGPLRHYFQHLQAAVVGLAVCWLLYGKINWTVVLLFLVSTYLIDLDTPFSGAFYINQFPYLQRAKKYFWNGEFKKCECELTDHHKLFDKLFLHNMIGFIAVVALFVYGLATQNIFLFFITGGVLSHFILDILDDLYQLGHIRNWLRPRFLFRID